MRGGEERGRGLIERGYELEELVVSVWNLEAGAGAEAGVSERNQTPAIHCGSSAEQRT